MFRFHEEVEDNFCAAALFLQSCVTGVRPIAANRADRYEVKVDNPETAGLRGGDQAVKGMALPWADWGNYYGTSDASRGVAPGEGPLAPAMIGVNGALLDLEIERVELIKFNLFDNNGTYANYVMKNDGPAIKIWPEMRLPADHPNYKDVGGDAPRQVCTGDLIRKRTLTGICNDIFNPLMGSSRQLFARNAEFESTFPDLSQNQLTRNRHGDRLSLLQPDPQVISRRLFTRHQDHAELCREGYGAAIPAESNCDYQKAPLFNVLAAFWIQWMTHDWFSHLEEGHNDSQYESTGCETERVNNVVGPLTPEEIQRLGCRPGDRIDRAYVAQDTPPGTFSSGGRQYLDRAPKTMRNTNTAWWDASQIYGYDDVSVKRVKRDPQDSARLLLLPLPAKTSADGLYLPVLAASDPMNPEWAGQEATAFPDNWTIGLSFLTNVFAREHNAFVEEFGRQAARTPDADSGLRNPAAPEKVIRYRDVTNDELYDVARLVVAAEIAKIHTIEWTPQLLYDEPLYIGMNANWSGLLGGGAPEITKILHDITGAQRMPDGSPIIDCLGHPNGTLIDNIEDVDLVVGFLAEPVRPHGFAISETQFVVFILNASRRLFSDRFLTSSFRPEFYTTLGLNCVKNNGPGEPQMEKGMPNGHQQPVSLFKRVLDRTIPELRAELDPVINVFDPWARARGQYYCLDWTPRPGAESDDAFQPPPQRSCPQ